MEGKPYFHQLYLPLYIRSIFQKKYKAVGQLLVKHLAEELNGLTHSPKWSELSHGSRPETNTRQLLKAARVTHTQHLH